MNSEEDTSKLRYRYPFEGMTETDLLGIFFVYFDTNISNKRILQSVDTEIWSICESDVKLLKELKDDGERYWFPELAKVTDADIELARKQRLVYSPYTMDLVLDAEQRKSYNKLSTSQKKKYVHDCLIEFDKSRIERFPNKCYPICKENENHPLAKKRIDECELEEKHRCELKKIEAEAIKEMENANMESLQTNCDVMHSSIFDLFG